ncbi:uncharacterized protein M6B38_273750 [Iris pallida]|uniref:Uncharacterized protein n=1 Tax=Iris pallida TaxID=29817 RepID=A0AAX6I7B0_IRIPA|nr:uncharacterized protein M6B38_273750 [Iris pallida]
MDESADLQEWELLQNSDSDTDAASMRFEEIIRSDYFAIDPNNHRSKLSQIESVENSEDFSSDCDKGGPFPVGDPELEVGFEGIWSGLQVSEEMGERCFKEFGAGSGKEAYFLPHGSELGAGSEGIEPRVPISGDEVGMEGIRFFRKISEEFHYGSEKRDSFHVDDSGGDVDFEGIEGGELGKGGSEEFGTGSVKEPSFLSNGSEMELGFGGSEGSESEDLGSNSVVEMSDSGSVPVGDGEKRRLAWWKLPMEILKLFVFRMRPLWSIPIAAAVIGIVMMGRRLYRMKHKNQRVPLKISFEDKKAAAKLLVRAARLNEAAVRRAPVVGSPFLPASGVTPWSLVGLL